MFSWCASFPLTLTIFHPYFHHVSWTQVEGPDGALQFRLSLHNVRLWVSAPAQICYQRKPLWWWLDKAQIYGYSRISLESFNCFLVFYLFVLPVGLALPLVSMISSFWFLAMQAVSRKSSLLWNGLQVKSDFFFSHSQWWYCTTIAPAHLGRTDCWSKVLWLGQCPGCSFGSLQSTFPHQRH